MGWVLCRGGEFSSSGIVQELSWEFIVYCSDSEEFSNRRTKDCYNDEVGTRRSVVR